MHCIAMIHIMLLVESFSLCLKKTYGPINLVTEPKATSGVVEDFLTLATVSVEEKTEDKLLS